MDFREYRELFKHLFAYAGQEFDMNIPEMEALFGQLSHNGVVSYNNFLVHMYEVRQHVSAYEMRRIGFDYMDAAAGNSVQDRDKHISADEFIRLVENAAGAKTDPVLSKFTENESVLQPLSTL